MLYRLLLAALAASASAVRIAPSAAPHAKLVFLRHGQSTWNQLNLFTGWVDVELSELGFQEWLANGGLTTARRGRALQSVSTRPYS